jgi:hypothetical protein
MDVKKAQHERKGRRRKHGVDSERKQRHLQRWYRIVTPTYFIEHKDPSTILQMPIGHCFCLSRWYLAIRGFDQR